MFLVLGYGFFVSDVINDVGSWPFWLTIGIKICLYLKN